MYMSASATNEQAPCPPAILKLVERFHEHLDAYKQQAYKETQVRREFIDPFFTALGWDVANRAGHAEAYKDVIHEDAIKVGGSTKAPDYCFRIGGVRKFFVEAKKPVVGVKDEPGPAYQLRRYAWSNKLPLSIVTDFEELAVYDCRIKPNPTDKPSTARVKYIVYEEYGERWDEIASIFAKDAILKGSFDKYAESTRRKRGTAEVDAEFLKEIEEWRELLARNIALRNRGLSVRELNFAVTRTIDRIIFLRMCEDRGVETYEQLRVLPNGPRIYPRLVELFYRADERYNSGLFHFQLEKGRAEEPDELTPDLVIDDRVLKDIIKRLYYPECPYEFSVLPAEILGHVYEQFLGKVIRLTKGHRAVVEDKPEVKKAGGVYYTPSYIVDYIVKHTVGKLLESKTPADVGRILAQRKGTGARHPTRAQDQNRDRKGADKTLRILDPACGSGSFLLGAYQYLLDWHLKWYGENDPEKWTRRKNPPIYQSTIRNRQSTIPIWRLTVAERKRILLNNIYGVDIDPQAVEVTKLSLLLKVLEGENQQTLENQLRLFHERALPDLGSNIKCGNSLIGPDFYDNQQLSLLGEEERYRINAFDWHAEFPDIFKPSRDREGADKTGGFDAVIGNPPYIRIQSLKEFAPREADYYKRRFVAASKGNFDIYVLFVERGLQLLNVTGRLGFILPHKFFNAKYGEPLRKSIAEGSHLSHVVHFTDQQVFAGATTYTCLMFLDKKTTDDFQVARVTDLTRWRTDFRADTGTIVAAQVTSSEWNFNVGQGSELFERMRAMPTRLGDVAERIAQGIRTSANEVYVLEVVSESTDIVTARSVCLKRTVELERLAVKLFLKGREIKPFRIMPSGLVVIIPYEVSGQRVRLTPEEEYQAQFPHTYTYLRQNRTLLESRERGRMRGPSWYGYVYPKNIDIMGSSKILVPDIANRASFALDGLGVYAFTSGYGIALKASTGESPKYILGLLNSKTLDFFLKRVSTTLRGGYFRYFTQYVEQLPIRRVNFNDRGDKARHDRMVELVERMLSLHKELDAARTPVDKTAIGRQIEATDRQIDQLVYDLYGLTSDEIKIVEEATRQ